jgi:hypothetical protein
VALTAKENLPRHAGTSVVQNPKEKVLITKAQRVTRGAAATPVSNANPWHLLLYEINLNSRKYEFFISVRWLTRKQRHRNQP